MAGHLYIIAAPSGAGKTSLVSALVKSMNDIVVSVSYTTRHKRSKEKNNVNYHFVNHEDFERLIEGGEFLEYAKVFDHYYGTSKYWVEQQLGRGIDVILEIDWQGAKQVREIMPNCTSIFILPPSLDALRERLTKRNQDDIAVIDKRLEEAKSEMTHYHEYDYVIINEIFREALIDLKAIVRADRLKYQYQQEKHAELLSQLVNIS